MDVERLEHLSPMYRFEGFYDLVVMDWAVNLELGPNNQVRCNRAPAASFTQLSVEDVGIIQRRIGVVENIIPTRIAGRTNRTVIRSRRVTSFIDELRLEDYLLDSNKRNARGKNIVLRLS